MSRSGYVDDLEPLELGRWRGRVASAIRGKRGQALLRDILAGMDALPEKVLILGELRNQEGDCCAMGAACLKRGVDTVDIDPAAPEEVAAALDVADCLAQEVAAVNDDWGGRDETPAQRFERVRAWVEKQLRAGGPSAAGSDAPKGGE